MRSIRSLIIYFATLAAVGVAGFPQHARASELRRTAMVKAVQRARPAVVNIRGEKTLPPDGEFPAAEGARRVNGMGTGVIIDERGYILTNYHVVEDVHKIQVTLADGRISVATVQAQDAEADLAVIKIGDTGKLPVITLGSSADLMLAEPVLAIGNPYGYEHTITRGVISSLHRSVQVTDTQMYEDLIQTDTSINPGNSGGPLLNIDGEMIGIVVAVRAGAQGISFAIPIDRALEVAAKLMETRRDAEVWHGVVASGMPERHTAGIVVKSVQDGSPAQRSGLREGDTLLKADDHELARSLDFERALIGHRPGDDVRLTVRRGGESVKIDLVLTEAPAASNVVSDATWRLLGLRLKPVSQELFQRFRTRYRGGLYVTDVRPGSPAASQGIRRGDVLLGMHIWETISLENVTYILNRPDFGQLGRIKFYILRGNETLYGHMMVSANRRRRG